MEHPPLPVPNAIEIRRLGRIDTIPALSIWGVGGGRAGARTRQRNWRKSRSERQAKFEHRKWLYSAESLTVQAAADKLNGSDSPAWRALRKLTPHVQCT